LHISSVQKSLFAKKSGFNVRENCLRNFDFSWTLMVFCPRNVQQQLYNKLRTYTGSKLKKLDKLLVSSPNKSHVFDIKIPIGNLFILNVVYCRKKHISNWYFYKVFILAEAFNQLKKVQSQICHCFFNWAN